MSVLTQIKLYRIRFYKTLALYTAFLVYGMTSGILGPTLLDLQISVKGTIAEVSYVLPGRSLGIIIGSLVTGFIYPKCNFQLLIACCMILAMLCNIAVPLNSTVIGLMATFAVNGFVGGIICGANNFILQLWGKESQPFMQVLQSCFGIGCILSPLVARPFLLPVKDESHSISNETIILHHSPNDVKLIYPYGIVAILHIIPVISFLYLFWKHPACDPHPSRINLAKRVTPEHKPVDGVESISEKVEKKNRSVDEASSSARNTFWKAVMIVVVLIYMPCLYGTELTYGNYLTTFAVESKLHMTKGTAVILTSMYWTIFTLFRFAPVLYIHLIGAEMNIVINTVIMLTANFFTYPWAENNEFCLWIGTFLMGVGQSSTFASVFGFLDNYLTVSSFLTSLMLVTSFVGEFIFPVIISQFFDKRPKIFLEVVLSCTLAMSFLFFLSVLIARLTLRKRSENERSRAPSNISMMIH